MKSFKEIKEELLQESIEDKGIFKAVFLGGSPGAGKSYVRTKIDDGQIEPRVINTDKFLEFIASNKDIDLGEEPPRWLIDRSKQLSKKQLIQYLNSMLPLFVDGTSANATNVLRRSGILEGFGYDVGMVWINTSLETTIERIEQRERNVDIDFVKKVHEELEDNKQFYKNKFSPFVEIDNDEGMLSDDVILNAYKTVSGFYLNDIENPIGKRNVEELKEEGGKYLSPTLYSFNEIERSVDLWYKKK